MHILIGLAVGVALLYFWLVGWWFARALVFLILGFGLFFLFADGARDPSHPLAGWIAGLLGLALAWPAAAFPTYYWRHQARRYRTKVLAD